MWHGSTRNVDGYGELTRETTLGHDTDSRKMAPTRPPLGRLRDNLCRRGRGLVIGCGAVALGATTLAACGGSSPNLGDQAAHLRQLDPGARLGGATVVGTGNGQRLVGQARPNVMVALGPNETIVGGPDNDQLGALGPYATIKAGPGTAQLFGGPHATLISGTGGDLLTDSYDDGTIQLTGSGNEVVVSGNHDRILCSPTSRDDVIYDNRTDSVDPTCVQDNAQVLPVTHSPFAVGVARQALVRLASDTVCSAVCGHGSTNVSEIGDCSNVPVDQDCAAAFPRRSLPNFWQNEYVPSYKCPSSHPYLVNKRYEPMRMELINGVQVNQHFVDVSITGGLRSFKPGADYFLGTLTGLTYSSATSWATAGDGSYQIVLHCTNNTARVFPG